MRKKIMTVFVAVLLLAAVFAGCGKAETNSGTHSFTLSVTDIDGNETVQELTTDEQTVGDALLKSGIISGDEGPYGLYVKVVNGITADYDTDGTFWAFYIDGQMAMSGVDSTSIEDGTVYGFRVEK